MLYYIIYDCNYPNSQIEFVGSFSYEYPNSWHCKENIREATIFSYSEALYAFFHIKKLSKRPVYSWLINPRIIIKE